MSIEHLKIDISEARKHRKLRALKNIMEAIQSVNKSMNRGFGIGGKIKILIWEVKLIIERNNSQISAVRWMQRKSGVGEQEAMRKGTKYKSMISAGEKERQFDGKRLPEREKQRNNRC